MSDGMLLALIQNAALLLAMALLYDLLTLGPRRGPATKEHVITGLALGLIGVAVMMAAHPLAEGIVFDTRSILLGVSGLFFGALPTSIAMAMAAAYRIFSGGEGMWMGLAVIFSSGLIGIAWRHLSRKEVDSLSWAELLAFGFVVHLVMLLCTALLPGPATWSTLRVITLPFLLVYPLGTAVLGILMAQRLHRKRTLAALVDSERRFKQIVEHSTQLHYAHTSEHVLTYASPQCRHFLGCDPGEAMVRWTEFVTDHPVNALGFEATQRAIESGEPQPTYELQLKTKDGRVIWVEVHEAPVVEGGRTVAIVGALADITERKRAEEAIRTSEAKYRRLHESMRDAFVSVDMSGRIREFNRSYQQMMGYEATELLELTYPDLTPEKWHALEGRIVEEQILPRGYSDLYEKEYRRKDGTVFPVELRTSLVTDHLGRPESMWAVVRDLTERKRAEARGRWLSSILEQSLNEITVFDGETHRFTYANRGATANLGYTLEELSGLTPADLYLEPGEDVFMEHITRLGDEEAETVRFEATVRRRDGSTYPALLSILRSADEEGIKFVTVALDLTEQRRMEDQLRQAQKMESIGRLAGGVAHDFNNMLNIIAIYAELALRRLGPGDATRKDIEEIQKAAQRSANLTKQLLAFARKQSAMPRVLNLNDTLADMGKMLARLMGEDIAFEFEPGAGLWPVRVDPVQVDQILANLAVNARDAIEGPGRVTLETANVTVSQDGPGQDRVPPPGEWVRLTFGDSGRGMDEETLAHIFEPFFSTKESLGTGLGLATVYGIVSQNGGHIQVDSETERGTTFRIYLPRWTGGPDAPPETKAATAPRGTETVLVVEDEAGVLALTERILKSHGYNVMAALSPGDALLLAERFEGTIHLLLTDVVMPVLGGVDLSRKLTEARPGLKTLFMSGYPLDSSARRGDLSEGTHFLQKPFSIDGLLEAVRSALD